jgi:hypothetical protein
MGMISDLEDIVEAIVYLTEARHVTGEVLHVDAGNAQRKMVNSAKNRLAAAGIELPPAPRLRGRLILKKRSKIVVVGPKVSLELSTIESTAYSSSRLDHPVRR